MSYPTNKTPSQKRRPAKSSGAAKPADTAKTPLAQAARPDRSPQAENQARRGATAAEKPRNPAQKPPAQKTPARFTPTRASARKLEFGSQKTRENSPAPQANASNKRSSDQSVAGKNMGTPKNAPTQTSGRTAHEGQCPLYRRCGGCQLQNMDYPRQLAWKQAQVVELLGRFCRVDPIIGMKDPYHYRNKVQAAFGYDRSKHIISGVYQSSTHSIVPVKSCMTEDRKADKILATIRYLMPTCKMLPYDEKTGRGFLRHVLVKRGFQSGEIMVVLVGSTPIFPAKKRFVEELRKVHPDITTVIFNINSRYASMVLGDDERILYGSGYIEDTLCGCVFRISAKSFYQINPVQTAQLYTRAIELAELTGTERVIDAYCGVGTIGLIASRHAGQVLGVEVNKDAVRDAMANAKRNKIENATFHCADAGEFMRDMAQSGETADVVFIDPPRAGSDEKFLASLAVLAPKRIVYISCNPETQARDIRLLQPHGYQVKVVQPVDMFPHTNHIESVVLLCRTKK